MSPRTERLLAQQNHRGDFNKFDNSRMIKGSMRLGANYDIKEVLKDVAVH